jgi:hypothetical protein
MLHEQDLVGSTPQVLLLVCLRGLHFNADTEAVIDSHDIRATGLLVRTGPYSPKMALLLAEQNHYGVFD